MTAIPKTKLTPAEYLAIERKAEFKSEYYRGEMFAMAGAKYSHNLAKDNLVVALGRQFTDGKCRTLSSDQRVTVSVTGLYTYPDIVVLCEPPKFEDDCLDTLLNPRVIVEILSESTEAFDRGAKFAHYRQIPSLHEYVLAAQDRPVIERHVRQPDGSWLMTEFSGLGSTLEFTSIPARVPLAEIYRGVELDEDRLR